MLQILIVLVALIWHSVELEVNNDHLNIESQENNS